MAGGRTVGVKTKEVLLVTTNTVADKEIVEVLGLVQGNASGLALADACTAALVSLKTTALAQGANAVVGVRFSAVGRDMAFEVLAYGTAVVLI